MDLAVRAGVVYIVLSRVLCHVRAVCRVVSYD